MKTPPLRRDFVEARLKELLKFLTDFVCEHGTAPNAGWLAEIEQLYDELQETDQRAALFNEQPTSVLGDHVKFSVDLCCWIVEPAKEKDGTIFGYCVKWSLPDTKGRWLYVRHYYTDPKDPEAPSLNWCQHAAERNAEEFNKIGKVPSDFQH